MADNPLFRLPDRAVATYYAIQHLGTTDVDTLARFRKRSRQAIYRALADLRAANLVQSGITAQPVTTE